MKQMNVTCILKNLKIIICIFSLIMVKKCQSQVKKYAGENARTLFEDILVVLITKLIVTGKVELMVT